MNRSSRRSPPPVPQDGTDACEPALMLAGEDPVEVAATDWVLRREEGLSAEDEARLQAWLAADARHGEALARMQALWTDLAAVRPASAAQPPERAKTVRAPAGLAWVGSAGRLLPQLTAAAVAFALVGAGWSSWERWRQAPVFRQSFSTARGQQAQVRLPDGSILWLDTATRVDASFYRDRREVRLPEGQLMFSVQPDAQRPFDVLAGPLRVTVVGTRFSVRQAPGGLQQGAVSVHVEEGRVRVVRDAAVAAPFGAAPAGSVLLTAGQAVAADARGELGRVTSADPGRVAPWRQSRVDFDGTPLSLALAEFERYGASGLRIRDPRVAALRVSGSFDLRRVDAFARALPQVLPVRLEASGGSTEIALASAR
jgi:transmembrane sensor